LSSFLHHLKFLDSSEVSQHHDKNQKKGLTHLFIIWQQISFVI